ncbi:M15 family metallopeptidase [uncultured Clostridium sp.]|jgi:LAS superfamily LD-carboxypeptidase LdcB|uniref:M15 family metallopeptidase n=1 Tax=uncultured Clostridium sp. TaxID=59620 RepID=UPI00261CDEC5|nr:M15 family metallopeptidase [uncultured Clostridium sp.]
MNLKEYKEIKIGGIIIATLLFVVGVAYFAGGGQIMSNNDNNITIKDNENLKEDEDNKEPIEDILDEETAKVFSTVRENKNDLIVLCNKEFMLGEDYTPDDLVVPNVLLAYDKSFQQSHLREEGAKALEVMFAEAKDAGLEDLYLVSGYRSYDYQYGLFNTSIKNRGKEHTEKYMAKPGHSEHQTGLTADISTQSMGLTLEENFEDTKEGEWLAANAHKYGYILRYPKDRVETTGYAYEPWHFRYVGKSVSEYMYKNKLVLEDLHESVYDGTDAVG